MTTLKVNQFHLFDDLVISTFTYNLIKRMENASVLVVTTLKTWTVRSRDRGLLMQMSDHMLSDIGLTRADVALEANKYFWQR